MADEYSTEELLRMALARADDFVTQVMETYEAAEVAARAGQAAFEGPVITASSTSLV